MSEAPDAPDTRASSQVTDHAFTPGPNPYLCGECGLGGAAHDSSALPPEVNPLPTPEVDLSVMQEQHEDFTGRMQELPRDILTRGRSIVDGERQEQHGDPVPNLERVARGWSIICEAEISAHQVALMMVWFKVVRESRNHNADNLDDIEGYTDIARRVVEELGS